jgi:adenine C2-methylase RlmN of 23S rRNA A2503 and tRNA A37
MERQTLTETVGGLIEPKRKVTDPLDVRINKWIATKDMFGINDLKPFTHVFIGGQEKQVEKITSSAIDRRWVNSVIYPEHPGDNSIPCGVQTTLGCPVGCLFCINWRTQKDKNGHSMRFVRRLTAGEMMSQVYQSMTTGQRLRNLFGFDSKVGLTVNFTGAGDGLVYNLHNCVLVIKQLAKIEKPQVSFIMTSVGSERQLQVYLDRYTYLPRVTHYWSVNFLNLRKRDLFMPGTKGQSLKNMRDLYARISDRTGKMVTASFALFKGINNKEEDADKIASFFKNQPFKIKLMAGCPGSLNGVPDITNEEVATFHKMVVDAGIDPDRVRDRIIFGSGDGENSGCGRTEASFIINGRV